MQNSVMKLTSPVKERQVFDAVAIANRQPASLLLHLAAVVLLLAIGSDVFATETWQPTTDITAAAEDYLRARSGDATRSTTVRAGALDPRLRLPLCDAALEGFLRRGAEMDTRTIVGVRCTGSKPWKVFVPVDVIVTAKVITTRHALPRGQLVTADDLVVIERDVSGMRRGYYTDARSLQGLRLKQPLLAGQVITPAMLAADQIVRRGQTVTLIATGGGVNISMTGKAMTDGALGQRIRVENLNSGRVVEGIVRSPEHVEVMVSRQHSFFNAKPKVSPDPADTRVSNNDR